MIQPSLIFILNVDFFSLCNLGQTKNVVNKVQVFEIEVKQGFKARGSVAGLGAGRFRDEI